MELTNINAELLKYFKISIRGLTSFSECSIMYIIFCGRFLPGGDSWSP